MSNQHFENAEFQKISTLIYDQSGIVLDGSKKYLIESRLGPLLDELQLDSYGDLYNAVQSSAQMMNRFIDEISTNETFFFRDSAPFELLKFRLLPELLDQLQGRERIRVWSAGSSTGQEIYSIAIACRELIGSNAHEVISILGTDISDAAIRQASAGSYSKLEIERGLSSDLRDRYFERRDNRWVASGEIRAMATFRHANLLEDFSGLGAFDVIFCRNVAIYFDKDTPQDLFTRLGKQLKSDGALVLGASENLIGIANNFERREHMRCTYYALTY